jgi:hypothetical protein
MGIRQKSVHKGSEVGVERFGVYVADTGDGSGSAGILPIPLVDVAKVEVMELGVAVEGTLSGGTPTFTALLEKHGDEGYAADGTDVAESDAAGDAGATDEWGVTRFDPPTEILPDYSDASAKLNSSGAKRTIGKMKLSLKKGGDATTFSGWIWCKLRIHRVEDI